jgi:hypothetical protein
MLRIYKIKKNEENEEEIINYSSPCEKNAEERKEESEKDLETPRCIVRTHFLFSYCKTKSPSNFLLSFSIATN